MITNKDLTELNVGLNEKQIAALRVLIDAHTSTKAMPNIVDGTKLVAKWCTKHKQYELASTFPKNTRSGDGLYSHCRYAEKHAKRISAKITKLQNEHFSCEDEKRQVEIKAEVIDLKAARTEYDYQIDTPKDIQIEQAKFEKKYAKELAKHTA